MVHSCSPVGVVSDIAHHVSVYTGCSGSDNIDVSLATNCETERLVGVKMHMYIYIYIHIHIYININK